MPLPRGVSLPRLMAGRSAKAYLIGGTIQVDLRWLSLAGVQPGS